MRVRCGKFEEIQPPRTPRKMRRQREEKNFTAESAESAEKNDRVRFSALPQNLWVNRRPSPKDIAGSSCRLIVAEASNPTERAGDAGKDFAQSSASGQGLRVREGSAGGGPRAAQRRADRGVPAPPEGFGGGLLVLREPRADLRPPGGEAF